MRQILYCLSGVILIASAVYARPNNKTSPEFPQSSTSGDSTAYIPEDFEEQLDSLLRTPVNSVSKSWQNIRIAPASVTIVTERDIRWFGYRTLAEVLATQRGFYTSNDRNYSYIGVRGFSRPGDYNNRLLVLVNGHYVNENVFGSAGFSYDLPLNFDIIERIEIVRGPGSVVYGTGAMFAVVNIITRTGKELDGISAAAEIGSKEAWQAQLAAGQRLGDIDIALSAVAGNSEGTEGLYFPEFDTDTTTGIAYELDYEQYYSISGRALYEGLSVQGYISFRKKGIPTASFNTAFNHPGAETIDQYGLLELRYEHNLSADISLLLRANYNTYNYTGSYFYPEESPDSSTNKWIGAEAQLCWDIMEFNRIIVGIEHKNNLRADYRNRYAEAMLFSRDEPFSSTSVYIQDELQIRDNLNITGGIRADYHTAAGLLVVPRFGIIYNPHNKTALKLLYGSAFRSPNFNELYLSFPEESKESVELQSEKISALELTAEQQIGDNVYTVMSLYYNRVSNLIDQRLDPTDSLLQYQNNKAVRALGAEIEVNTRSQYWRTYASYALQSSVDEARMTLSNSPAHLLRVGACVSLDEFLSVAVEIAGESARRTVYSEETKAFVIAGMNITWQPVRSVELSLKVSNMFNTSYALPGGWEHRQRSIDQNGRTIKARVRVDL